jgi:hypothetical protein
VKEDGDSFPADHLVSTRFGTPAAQRTTGPQTALVPWSIRYRLLCWLLRLLVRCGLDELDLETVVRGPRRSRACRRDSGASLKPRVRARFPHDAERTGRRKVFAEHEHL